MNVLVFCEHNPSMDSPEGKAAYPEGLGECLAPSRAYTDLPTSF